MNLNSCCIAGVDNGGVNNDGGYVRGWTAGMHNDKVFCILQRWASQERTVTEDIAGVDNITGVKFQSNHPIQ